MVLTIQELKPHKHYPLYWEFACERMNIWWRRFEGKKSPWVSDPDSKLGQTLQKYKFTNCYRVLDRASQYLLKNIIYDGNKYSDEDMIFRILFFKVFNKEETWESVKSGLKEEPTWSEYSFKHYDKIFLNLRREGTSVFSPAYIMRGGCYEQKYKYQDLLKMLEGMMKDDLTSKLKDCKTAKQAYDLLLSYKLMGSFLSYQYLQDLCYSSVIDLLSKSRFVIAGPGAKRGIRTAFKDWEKYSFEDIIRCVSDNQEQELKRLGFKFRYLPNHKLDLSSIQNLFCEYSKVTKELIPGTKGRIKVKFDQPNPHRIRHIFPPKWKVEL